MQIQSLHRKNVYEYIMDILLTTINSLFNIYNNDKYIVQLKIG